MSVLQTLIHLSETSEFSNLNNTYRESDLETDKKISSKYKGSSFIFLDRDFGSLLFPLQIGASPAWLEAYSGYENANWYHLEPCGKSRKITSSEAINLAHQAPSIDGLTNFAILRQLRKALTDRNVTNSGLTECRLTIQSNLSSWKGWFESSGNVVMQEYLNKVMKSLT